MKRTRGWQLRLLATLMATGLSMPALADDLTLSQAVTQLLSANHDIRLAGNAIESAQADQMIAGARPNPFVTLQANQIGLYGPPAGNGTIGRQVDAIVSWSQPIERGNKRGLRMEAAKANLAAATASRQSVLRDTLAMLYGSYYDLAAAQQRLRIADAASALYERTLNAAELRFKAGDIAAADLARIRVEAMRSRNEAAAARGQLQQSQLALARLLARESDAYSLSVSEDWPSPQPMPAEAERDALVEVQPDVIAARQKVVAGDRGAQLARALRANDVVVSLQYERLPTVNPDTVGVGLSFPIQVGNNYAGDIRRADSDLATARLVLDSTRHGESNRIASEYAALGTSLRALQLFQGDILANARKAADAAEYAYQRGASSLLELLDARRTLFAVQLDALAAQTEYARHLALWDLLAHPREN